MKNIYKKVILIAVILMLLFSINAKVYAWSGIIEDGKDFIGLGQDSDGQAKIDADKMQEGLKGLSGYLYNILLAAGVVIAVIVATVLGIQFMIGGAEGQAKVKEMLVPFVVGCVVVFGGFGIWKIAVQVGSSMEDVKVYTANNGRKQADNNYKIATSDLSNKSLSEVLAILNNISTDCSNAFVKRMEAEKNDPKGDEFQYWESYVTTMSDNYRELKKKIYTVENAQKYAKEYISEERKTTEQLKAESNNAKAKMDESNGAEYQFWETYHDIIFRHYIDRSKRG